MKRFLATMMTTAMLFAYAGTAGAAVQQKPIQVLLNGEPVQFAVAPAAIEGKTFVEFRSLFVALGYEVAYDTVAKKITAVSGDRTIEMTVGADAAFVDGAAVPVDNQLRIDNGRTLVGVRFIATLSGKDVAWDAAAKTVVIVDGGPTAEQEAAVFALLDKMQAAEEAWDYDATIALFSDDSPLREDYSEELAATWDRLRTKTTILEKKIVSYSAEETVLETVEENVKTGGTGFSPDARVNYVYTLRPAANGEWRIYNLQVVNFVATNVPELFEQAADVPAEEATALRAVLDRQIQALQEENLDDYLATMHLDDAGMKEAASAQIRQLFDTSDSKMTIEKFVVADYYDTNRATILFEAVTEVQVAGQTVKVRSVMANDAEKRDGTWLLDPVAIPLENEQL